MNNKETQWINIVRNVKFTPRERDSMRRSLVQFMEAHPVRDVKNARLYIKPSRNIINVKFLTYKAMIIGLIIALVMGGSVSFAAENTIPGDVLYPVKVYVNENARVAVAFSYKSKAELAVELANRRIEEAGKLAVRGTLDVETETQVNAKVESQINAAKEKVALLKSHDEDVADEVEVDLDSVLNAHGIVLAKAKIEKEREHNEKSAHSIDVLGTILAKMESEGEDDDGDKNRMAMTAVLMGTTTMMNASSTLAVTTREAAEGKMKAAQNKLTEVARKLARGTAGTASTTAQVKFAEAEGVFAQGEISFTAGAYADAFNAFKQTMKLAQQAKRLADLEEEFTGEFSVDLHESDDEDDDVDDDDNSTTTSKRRGDEGDDEREGKKEENSSSEKKGSNRPAEEGITFEQDSRIPSGPPGSIGISRNGPSRVIEWKGTRDDTVLGYEVYRSCSQGEWVKLSFVPLSVSDERNAGLYRYENSFSGECKYSVAAVGSDGKPGPRSVPME